MLEVTAGGGGHVPLCPPHPLWIRPWAFEFYVIELSGMRGTLFICLQYRSATSPTIFALNLAVNFWLKFSLSTFDWNIRYQLLIETFGVEIWLKLLIAFRCQLLTETFDSISLSTFDSDSLSTFDSNSLSTFDYHSAVEPSSALLNSNWFVSTVGFESCCLNLIAFRV